MTLPVPLNRTELFLAKIAGEDVTPPEPQSRQEMFLAKLAGADIVLPEPLSLTEQWLALCAGMAGVTAPEIEGACLIGVQKVDVRFFAVASGLDDVTAPEPQNRTEEFWAKIAEEMSVKTITVKGTDLHLLKVVSGIDDLQYVYGDTSQQTYTGKNLFNINTTPTWIGVDTTYSVSGNTLHVEGKWFVGILTPVEKNTNYYISATRKNLSGGTQTGHMSVYGGKNTDYITTFQTGNGTFNSGNRTSVYLVFYADSGTAGNYADFENIQLEKGTTGTDYEPYVGGTASPNPDYPQDVKVVTGRQVVNMHGKNWAYINNGTGTRITNTAVASDQTITINSNEHGTETSWCLNDVSYVSQWAPSYSNARDYHLTGMGGTYTVTLYYENLPSGDGTLNGYVYTNKQQKYIPRTAVVDNKVFWTVTLDNDEYIKSVYLYTAASNFFNDFKVNVQVESGTTTDHDFEPYQGQEYELNLGKNLFADTLRQGVTNYETNVYTPTNSARITSTDWIVLPAGTYTFNAKTSLTKTLQVSVISFTTDEQFYNISGVSGIWKTLPSTFTTPIPIKFKLNLSYTDSADITTGQVSNIMLEHGSTATPYAPYFTPIELCKIGDYQDYIYKSGSDWYVHKACGKQIVDVSGLTLRSSYSNVEYGVYAKPSDSANYGNYYEMDWGLFYTHATHINADGGFDNAKWAGKIFMSPSKTEYWVGFAKGTGLDTIKTYLNGAELYYSLKTPTDTQITDSTLISQLNALDSAILPTPEAFVTVSGNLPAPIQFTYEGKE